MPTLEEVGKDFLSSLETAEKSLSTERLFSQIEPDQIRIRNRLLDVLEINPEGEECQLLRKQLQQLNELISVVLNDSEHNDPQFKELYSELLGNGGITPMGIYSEGKVISLAQERYKRTTSDL